MKTTLHVNWRELEEAAQDVVKESGGRKASCVRVKMLSLRTFE